MARLWGRDGPTWVLRTLPLTPTLSPLGAVRQVHLGTGAVTTLGGTVGGVTDIDVDTFTGTA